MKHAILILLILAFVIPASALELTEKGVKTGLNFSNVYGADVEAEYFKSRIGIALGGYLVFQYNEQITIHPELYYTGKGYELDLPADADPEEGGKFAYLEIPVLCGYHFMPDNEWDPTLLFGPYLGFLLSADVDGMDFKEYTSSIDFGLGIGFSVKYDKFTFNLRDGLGLTSVYDSDEFPDLKNMNLQLIAGYSF